MSTDQKRTHTCAGCGRTFVWRPAAISSTDIWLFPFPDLRSSAEGRGWVQECPFCGYPAPDVSLPASVTQANQSSEEDRICGGLHFQKPLAAQFYRQHLILLRERKFSEAVFALLRAAQLCDDAGEADNAVACRSIAAGVMEMYVLPAEREEAYLLLYADILRRAGQFDKLLDKFTDVWFSNAELRKLLIFQYVRAVNRDAGRYTVEDAEAFYAQLQEAFD